MAAVASSEEFEDCSLCGQSSEHTPRIVPPCVIARFDHIVHTCNCRLAIGIIPNG